MIQKNLTRLFLRLWRNEVFVEETSPIKMNIIIFLLIFATYDLSIYKIGKEIGLKDLGTTEFFDITDFNIGKDKIYLTDTAAFTVYLFDKDGAFVQSTGREGRGPGEFIRGPYQITNFEDTYYVLGYSTPYFYVFDESLEFIENKKFEENLITVPFLKSYDQKLIIVPGRMWDEELILYDPETSSIKNIQLDFEIVAGLLAEYNVFKMGDDWLFAWYNQNKFKLYDENFKLINNFSIPELPDKADGVYADDPIRPPNASERQLEKQEAGAFAPSGTFFEEFLILDDEYLMVQFGDQTGDNEQALIMNTSGEVVQEINLPVSGKPLVHEDGILYMFDATSLNVVAYEFHVVEN